MHYVYKFFNTINGRIYIGKSSSQRSREAEHRYVAKGGKDKYKNSFSLIHKAIQKYGKNIEYSIIQEFLSELEAFEAEKYWISFFKSNVYKHGNEFGYNLTDGGDGLSGYKHSEETKILIRSKVPRGAHHRNYQNSSWRNKNNSGKNHPMFGKSLSKETKQKISFSNSGSKNHNYGKRASEETRKRMSNSAKGRVAWNKGIKTPDDIKLKQSIAHKGRGRKFSLEIESEIVNEYYKIKSMPILSKKYGCDRETISLIIKRFKEREADNVS